MTFSPKIQTFDGANAAHGNAFTCAVDSVNNRLWMADATNLAKYNISAGTETSAVAISTISHAGGSYVGVDNNGKIYLNGSNGLSNGAMVQVDGTSLAFLNRAIYTTPGFPERAIVKTGSANSILGHNVGNSVIGSLNNSGLSTDATFLALIGWPVGPRTVTSPGANSGSHCWMLNGSDSGGGPMYLQKISVTGTVTTIATPTPTDFDAGWALALPESICVDQSDGNPVLVVTNNSAVRLVKINASSGAIIWNVLCPSFMANSGEQLGQSFISASRLATWKNFANQNAVTIFNTTDGSVDTTYNTGFNGLTFSTAQSYFDALGCIIAFGTWDGTGPGGGGPTPLNGSTGPFTGWFALYVADGIVPPTPPVTNDDWFALMGPVRNRA